jgi:hypothetical protein
MPLTEVLKDTDSPHTPAVLLKRKISAFPSASKTIELPANTLTVGALKRSI